VAQDASQSTLAKQLIHETTLSRWAKWRSRRVFGEGVRQFNETFRRLFGRPPASLPALA